MENVKKRRECEPLYKYKLKDDDLNPREQVKWGGRKGKGGGILLQMSSSSKFMGEGTYLSLMHHNSFLNSDSFILHANSMIHHDSFENYDSLF